MKRLVQPEFLDTLPPEDPRSVRSRHDLRRINWWMCNPTIMARALENHRFASLPQQIMELGAGDGTFLLAVTKKIKPRWPDVKVILIDLQNIVSTETRAAFVKCGWGVETIIADIFNWPQADSDIVITNLFLHHFESPRLTELLGLISQRAKILIALEPRRAAWPLFCSHLLWAIGCNDVTRHDATVSVRAGFSGSELSGLWPDKSGWQLTEQAAGMFGHLFIARKLN